MEALILKFEEFLESGDELMKRGQYSDAHSRYFEALRTLAAFLAYRDTGMLVEPAKLRGFLGSYPEIVELLEVHSKARGSEREARSLRESLERLRGMMNLPSSEG